MAIDKALLSREPKAIEPGKYTVILEPSAAAGLLQFMLFNMNARQADEGRSFLAKAGGGNKIGEKIVDERVTIWSDPSHPDVPECRNRLRLLYAQGGYSRPTPERADPRGESISPVCVSYGCQLQQSQYDSYPSSKSQNF